MRGWTRLVAAVAMGLGVVALASGVATEIPAVRSFVNARAWLTTGDVIQFVFFWASLILMVVLSGGRVSTYGLRGTGAREIRSVLLVAGSVAGVIGVLGAAASVAGARGEGSPLSAGGGFLKTVVSIWIVASVSEEMLFRGLILGFLEPLRSRGFRFLGRRLSLPVTVAAIGFGLVHLGLLSTTPPPMVAAVVASATILGFVAGYYREKTGSIVPAIAAHFTFNFLGSGIPMLASLIVSR
jgi:membrane protease YdiL (CAAX protease family)